MAEPKYKRVLIKLSGEALAGERGVGIDLPTVQAMAKEIAEVADSGIQIALVIGGGNLWRGEPAAEAGMDRVQADYTGMLGTTMNALVMADSLKQLGDTPLRVTNIKPGLVETNFSVVRFRGDKEKADNVYKGIRPLTGDDIAETVYFAASVPEYMQIAEMLVMPTNQATGTIVSRK